VAQVLERLPSMREVLSSNSATTNPHAKKKKKTKKRKPHPQSGKNSAALLLRAQSTQAPLQDWPSRGRSAFLPERRRGSPEGTSGRAMAPSL
jgi:hypothetical protein